MGGETIIGIDPGKSGGIALIQFGDNIIGHILFTFKFSEGTEADIAHWFRANVHKEFPCLAYLEKASAHPKQGVVSVFTFGQNYGFYRGLLIALQIPFETIAPGKWQRYLGCLSGGDKNVTKAKAQELFPNIKVTHSLADALLIAEYGRRIRSQGKEGG